MPIHDWTRVKAGIFHDFHHAWIEDIKRALNTQVLPEDYYAMAEQFASGFGPDVLTLQSNGESRASGREKAPTSTDGNTGLLLAPPQVQFVGETDMEFYHRKQKSVTVRHVSGDRIVAMIEIVSPNNKSSRNGLRSFVEKAAELLTHQIHLMILDLFPPGKRDPQGIHAEVWEELCGQSYTLPGDKPLTLASYESGPGIRAYVEQVAVGDSLTDMPLFLEPGGHVLVPLDSTYQTAWNAVPRRWQRVLEGE